MSSLVRKTKTQIGVGTSAAVPMASNGQIGMAVILVSGVINATVEFTFDAIGTAAELAAAVWIPHPYLDGITGTTAGNIDKPVTAVRLVNAGAGTCRLVTNQFV